MRDMYDILTECALFSGLDSAEIKRLLDCDAVSIDNYEKGSVIAKKDIAYAGLLILLTGKASGSFTSPGGHQMHIDAIEAPQLIAPAFLFGGYNRLPIDVIADTDVEVLTLHRGYLFEMMQENVVVLSNFIDIISTRAGVWQKRLYALSYKTLKEKFASYLLENSPESTSYVHVADLRQLAELFGATRSSLESVIEGLEKKHVVEVKQDRLVVLNRPALQDILK